jgi:hypothetical protein
MACFFVMLNCCFQPFLCWQHISLSGRYRGPRVHHTRLKSPETPPNTPAGTRARTGTAPECLRWRHPEIRAGHIERLSQTSHTPWRLLNQFAKLCPPLPPFSYTPACLGGRNPGPFQNTGQAGVADPYLLVFFQQFSKIREICLLICPAS